MNSQRFTLPIQRHGLRFRMLSAVFAVALAVAAGSAAAMQTHRIQDFGAHADWREALEERAERGDIVRLYVFEDLEPGESAPCLAGSDVDASYDPAPAEAPNSVEGRWPESAAVKVDEGRYQAGAFSVGEDGFTASLWLRLEGMGGHRGNQDAENGMIMAVGNGYWEGWRITVSYPSRTPRFEMGRPQPANAEGVSGGVIPEGVWTHLAVAWNGGRLFMYVNGLLVAEQAFEDSYTPPGDGPFRIGYAAAGIGSVAMSIGEAAVFNRALSPAEVFREAHFHAPISDELVEEFVAAHRRAMEGERAGAGDAYAAIAADADVPSYYQNAALLQAAPLVNHVRPEIAVDALAVYLAHAEVEAGEYVELQMDLARRLQSAGDPGAARESARAVAGMDGVAVGDWCEAQLRIGHANWQDQRYGEAREAYRAVVEREDAPIRYRAAAQSRIGRAWVMEEDYAAARNAYEDLAAMETPLGHFEDIARERLAELDRMEAGESPWDPARSRVEIPERPAPGALLYVAPDGDDSAAGTAEAPLASLAGARDAIRELRAANGLPDGGVEVRATDGEYYLDEGLVFTDADSGTPEAPIVYTTHGGGTPRFTGGVVIDGFEPVSDEGVLARLPEASRERVLQADLAAQDVTDFGELAPRGFGRPAAATPELFWNGDPLELARWPNEGFVHVREVIDEEANEAGAVLGYEEDRPAGWAEPEKAWLFGYWYHHWADGVLGVQSVNPEARELTTAHRSNYGFREGQHYHYFNILEELERPGDWYLDRDAGVLYVYPPSDVEGAVAEFSILEDPMVAVDGASHLTLRGLTFDVGRGSGVTINGGESVLVKGCVLSRLAQDGVIINGGRNHGVLGSDLFRLGRGGVEVTGGDRATLEPGGHFVENNHIHDFSRLDRTYTPAVRMGGAGNRISHNLFNDAPHHAIRLDGNDHIVEYNEVHSVVYESDDQSGIDMWFNPAYRGNVIRYNFWHHIGSGLDRHGQAGIRLDDAISGVRMYGNVFYRSASGMFGAIQIHGGKDNIADGNVIVDCSAAFSISAWGPSRWQDFLAREDVVNAITNQVNIHEPPYADRYPELAELEEDPDQNAFWRNAIVDTGAFLLRGRGNEILMDNWQGAGDPGFANPEARDFSLSDDALIYSLTGMEPVPFEYMGPYEDGHRASWPIEHGVTPHYQMLGGGE